MFGKKKVNNTKTVELEDASINFSDEDEVYDISSDNELKDYTEESDIDNEEVDEVLENNIIGTDIENSYTEDENPNNEYLLFVLTDRCTRNMLGYFRNAGLNVSHIFTSISEASEAFMIQLKPCRLLIIDSGLGKFSSISSRKEILDVLGMLDSMNRIAIFYSDTNILSDAKDSINFDYKIADWYRYKSTADTIARLLLLKENYVLSDRAAQVNVDEDAINFKGIELVDENADSIDTGFSTLSLQCEAVIDGFNDENYTEIEGFKPKY